MIGRKKARRGYSGEVENVHLKPNPTLHTGLWPYFTVYGRGKGRRWWRRFCLRYLWASIIWSCHPWLPFCLPRCPPSPSPSLSGFSFFSIILGQALHQFANQVCKLSRSVGISISCNITCIILIVFTFSFSFGSLFHANRLLHSRIVWFMHSFFI